MKPRFSMRKALEDEQLLAHALPGESWKAWRILLIAACGEALRPDERRIFAQVTGRPREPRERVDELWLCVGRRGGKSRALATLSAYVGACCDHSGSLTDGEQGLVLCLAVDQRQASVIIGYAESILAQSPILSQEVRGRSGDTISLAGSISIEVRWAHFRRVRGVTCVACLVDEIAFMATDDGSSNPDSAVLEALRPTLSTTAGMLVASSSPYARKGELWTTFKAHHGAGGDKLILVAQAPSRVMNPSLKQRVVDRAYERDPISAAAEYGAEFRSDLEGYVSREALDACIANGVRERPPLPNVAYVAFCDMAGGSGGDSATLAIGHRERDRAVIDFVLEKRPPFRPSGTIVEFCEALRRYRVGRVRGDRYAGEWPREQFANRGATYLIADRDKSQLYLSALPSINSGVVDLLDNKKLSDQFVGLERRTRSGGRDQVDHAPKAHDDLANSVAGLIVLLLGRRAAPDVIVAPRFILSAPMASGVDGVRGRIRENESPPWIMR
nr:hypothetical protein [Nitrosomonas nitrosa]